MLYYRHAGNRTISRSVESLCYIGQPQLMHRRWACRKEGLTLGGKLLRFLTHHSQALSTSGQPHRLPKAAQSGKVYLRSTTQHICLLGRWGIIQLILLHLCGFILGSEMYSASCAYLTMPAM